MMTTGIKVEVWTGTTKDGFLEPGVICEVRTYDTGALPHYGVVFNDGRIWYLHPQLVFKRETKC